MRTSLLRMLIFLLCFAALAGLGQRFAGMIEALPHTTRKCLDDPKKCDGIALGVSVYVVQSVEDANHYTVARSGLELPVVGDSQALEVGQRISVKGRFHAEPTHLEAEYYGVHNYRFLKELYGLITLALVGWWLFRDWRIGRQGLYRA